MLRAIYEPLSTILNEMKRNAFVLCAVLWFAFGSLPCTSQVHRYMRVGHTTNVTVTPQAGIALMGGGEDLDEAFRWLCTRAKGGDLLVLRATGDDDYNPYIAKLCKLNSVATLVIPNRAAANDPVVARTIREASALFISGGDQSNYINYWMGSPVQTELNAAIARGVPIGGTSAGLAVLGEWAYSAQGDKPTDPNLDGKTAMEHPLGSRITLVHGFLRIPILKGVVTDTHFATRNRMGRLLVFLARLNEPDGKPLPSKAPHVRGIGVEQRAAVLLEPGGSATVVGHGAAYFVDILGTTGTVAQGKPLTFGPYAVQKVKPGHSFDLPSWSGAATRYTLTVRAATIRSTQPGGSVY